MKIVKYFYSEPTYSYMSEIIVNEMGNYVDAKNNNLPRKSLPRITVCGIFDMETRKMTVGISRCSEKDIFVKKIGQKLAYDRAENNPVATIDILESETMSNVFFDFARLLEKRYLSKRSFKF